MGEIIGAIKIIKMYCWEKPFADLVKIDRDNEVHVLKISSLMKAINSAIAFIQIRVVMFVTFIVYINFEHKLVTDLKTRR